MASRSVTIDHRPSTIVSSRRKTKRCFPALPKKFTQPHCGDPEVRVTTMDIGVAGRKVRPNLRKRSRQRGKRARDEGEVSGKKTGLKDEGKIRSPHSPRISATDGSNAPQLQDLIFVPFVTRIVHSNLE